MFGTFRFVLALLVMWQHLFDREMACGTIAVFGFFCLSGYLMTQNINGPYADGLPGFMRYLGNRALRIYPLYFVALALGLAVVRAWPQQAADVSPWFAWPENMLANIAIIGLDLTMHMAVPPAWSLAIEIIFYVAIGALLGRSRLATTLWFLASIEILIAEALIHQPPIEWYYFTPAGASIAFASGAMVFHWGRLSPPASAPVAAIAAAAYLTGAVLMSAEAWRHGGIYVMLAAAAGAIMLLAKLPRRHWDDRAGALAYPIFLFHVPSAALSGVAAGRNEFLTMIVGAALTGLISVASIVLIERPIERIRQSLRCWGRALPAAA